MTAVIHQEGAEEIVSIVYDGELAATGQLHFYEYGRAAYAFARLISTLEHFRRTGSVPKKIGSQNYVNIIIRAPEKGSFSIDIVIPIAMEAAKYISAIPLNIFFEYILHLITRLLPRDEKIIVDLAKIDLAKERQRTKQGDQETDRIREIKNIVESGNITTRAAIDTLNNALAARDTMSFTACVLRSASNARSR